MVVLACRNPRVATAVALAFGVCEEVVLGSIVWMLHTRGVLVSGAYLRADGLTAVFILNLGLVFVLVLVYAAGYLRHLPSERFSSPRWFYALLYLFLFTMLGAYLSANLGLL
jgi:formate hydrogenlyase subunit 3/multisubunit Na+/H+ antiporter MnhD subunit